MPCYDPPYPHDNTPSEAEKKLADANNELNRVEAMLCAIMTLITSDQVFSGVFLARSQVDKFEKNFGVTTSDIVDWFEQHKLKDLEKQKAEAARLDAVRLAALNKLTAEERVALGLE